MSAVPADLRIASPWRAALPALLLLWAAVLLLYRDTAAVDGRHLVALRHLRACLPGAADQRCGWSGASATQLALLTPRPQPWVLLPLAAVGRGLAAGRPGRRSTPRRSSRWWRMLVLAVPAVLGLAGGARAILFPLLFLFFAVPFGEFLLPTHDGVDGRLHRPGAAADAAFRCTAKGMQFVIPSGNWSVVEACSGVRYLIASFMVGTLFAYLNYRSTKRRVVFIGVSILVPIVANWLRAYMIVMLGHLSGNTHRRRRGPPDLRLGVLRRRHHDHVPDRRALVRAG